MSRGPVVIVVIHALLGLGVSACTQAQVAWPDRPPDAGLPPPSVAQIGDCCQCLIDNPQTGPAADAGLGDAETAADAAEDPPCLALEKEVCVDTLRRGEPVFSTEKCLKTFCGSRCFFLDLTIGETAGGGDAD